MSNVATLVNTNDGDVVTVVPVTVDLLVELLREKFGDQIPEDGKWELKSAENKRDFRVHLNKPIFFDTSRVEMLNERIRESLSKMK